MLSLRIDLSDPEELRDALALIQRRLADLEEAPVSGGGRPDPPSEAVAEKVVDDLWSRIGSDNTWALLRAFAELDGPATLTQVADHLGVDPPTIRARKFRFGRTENAINEKYGIELLPGEWQGTENVYEMPESIRRQLLSSLSGDTTTQ